MKIWIIELDIDYGNNRENEKADNKYSKEDHDDISMECNFVLNYARTDEEQLVMLFKKDLGAVLWNRWQTRNLWILKPVDARVYFITNIVDWTNVPPQM